MGKQKFQIDINDQSVRVRLNISEYSPHGRLYVLIFVIALGTLAICALLFLPGKHGNSSMWHDLSSYPVDSGSFIFPFVLLLGLTLLMVLLSWRYVVSAYPSDEMFHCDRSMLTVSKVRWLDFKNTHWDTCSYALVEIASMKYQAIASLRGTSIYGLRFIVGGRRQRVLPGLKASEADKILKALKGLGVDVPGDPKLPGRLQEEGENRIYGL
jgi:hypothetical protein